MELVGHRWDFIISRFFKNADAAGLTINSKSLLDCLLSLPARYLRRTLVSMPKVDTRGLQIETGAGCATAGGMS